MRTVILAGGFGTRLSEETAVKPKPMAEIGGRPMLWHIMNIYAKHGFTHFLIACGYKGEVIKEYFATFHLQNADVFVDLATGSVDTRSARAPSWQVGCVDTGLTTMTGGRLLALRALLDDGTFMATYGDGVGDVDITALVEFHRSHGRLATVTAVRPPSRFGGMTIGDGGRVEEFAEKSPVHAGWINGGFFVFEPAVLDYVADMDTKLEAGPLTRLAEDGELMAYRHDRFWKPMDTLREKRELEAMWESGEAPWKVW